MNPLQSPPPSIPKFDATTARKFLSYILDTEVGCTEVRVLEATHDRSGYIVPAEQYSKTLAGWYNNIHDMLVDLGKLRGISAYVTINPVSHELTSRRRNRLGKQKHTTKDEHVVVFRWLYIDIDKTAFKGASSTEDELAATIAVRNRILTDHPGLAGSAIWGTSGNGAWILVRLPDYSIEEGRELAGRALGWIAATYNNDNIEIDSKTKNASRIGVLPGTAKCKGENDPHRPHRLATLDGVAAEPAHIPRYDLKSWLDDVGVGNADRIRESVARERATTKRRPTPDDDRRHRVYRAEKYLQTKNPAISGQDGHTTAFIAARDLIIGFGLEIDEARPLYAGYSNRCDPPWSVQEQEHKLQDAHQKGPSPEFPMDYLYDEKPPNRADVNGHANGRVRMNGRPHADDDLEAISPVESEENFKNWDWDDDNDDEDAKPKKESLRIQTIAATLYVLSPGWPKRVAEQLFIQTPDYRPIFLSSSQRLFAWIDRLARVDWTKGANYVTQERFYEHLRMTTMQYDSIETLPHWPPILCTYYMHSAIPEAAGKLERLLDYFAPATPIDRQLIKALILTLFWGGSAGQRPGFLITGNDEDQEQGRGIGKSKLCDILSEELGGGYVDVNPTDDMKAVKTRLLSNEDGRKRVARLDNVKTHRFSWADLEGLITSSVISGHSMYQGEGRRPNTLIWLITLNGASFSKDMAQRVIPIKLKRPRLQAGWEDEVRAFCRSHRPGLLGDIRDLLVAAPGPLSPKLRWAAWERDVLTKLDDYLAIEKEIKTRQDVIDDDQSEKEFIIEHFRHKLEELGHDPDRHKVLIPSAIIADWVSEATRERYATNRASAFLKGLNVPYLSKSDREGKRMWMWTGKQADPHGDAVSGDRYRPYRLFRSRFSSDSSDDRSGHF